MIDTKHTKTSVSLFHVSGTVRIFATKAAARKALGIRFMRTNVGPNFRLFSHNEHHLNAGSIPVYIEHAYIMRDDCGSTLTFADFIVPRAPKGTWRQRRYGVYCGYGPVPGVHKPSGGHYHRRLHTTPAMRMAQVIEDDVPPRAKRNVANLPTSWDDYNIAAYGNHSWKRHRNTQWKAID